ncbi:hypothetical protein SNE40_014796 [Patella caerulea]|uniref:GOLD domain-containing protein n=1 Tax=Patella caerulea TaxID=87958 RepID=A0AAN8JHN5_PATCE
MALSILWVVLTVFVINNDNGIVCEDVLGEITDDFDFDGIPGATHEFKVEIFSGAEECFYLKIASGAKLHVSFEVLTPHEIIDFYFKDPYNMIIESLLYKGNGGIEHDINVEGIYSICLDNTFTSYTSKIVYIYIVTFIPEEWAKYVNEIGELHGLAENYTELLSGVQLSITEMKRLQAQSRFNVVKDWYLIKSNNEYIKTWSIAQSIIIVATSLFTVFFVRRLFKTEAVTPTSKPRA